MTMASENQDFGDYLLASFIAFKYATEAVHAVGVAIGPDDDREIVERVADLTIVMARSIDAAMAVGKRDETTAQDMRRATAAAVAATVETVGWSLKLRATLPHVVVVDLIGADALLSLAIDAELNDSAAAATKH